MFLCLILCMQDNQLLTEIKENEKQLTKSLREQLEQVYKFI